MSTREQVEAEAAKRYPYADPVAHVLLRRSIDELRKAFIAGRTVSADQWGMAAGRIQDRWNLCGDDAGCHCDDANNFAWEVARDAFRAAGFLIEGDTQ